VAMADEGFTSLYDGVSLNGWRSPGGADDGRWIADDWKLRYEPGAAVRPASPLLLDRQYSDFVLIADWKVKAASPEAAAPLVGSVEHDRLLRDWPRDTRAAIVAMLLRPEHAAEWTRSRVTVRGDRVTVALNDDIVINDVQRPGAPVRGSIALMPRTATEFANVFVKSLER
jgi:hypothetical protein